MAQEEADLGTGAALPVVAGEGPPPTTFADALLESRGWPASAGHDTGGRACAGHDAGGGTHNEWHDVGSLQDIPQRGARVVATARGDIAVFRTGDDRVFALHDACPHKAGRLSQGIVHGAFVTCPLHNWVISLEDGRAREPDEGCARLVPVRLDGTRILLAVDA